MREYWKAIASGMLINLTLVAGYILIFAGLVMFCWNIGMVWLIPNFSEMGYENAVALSAVGAIIHLSFNYWTNRILHIKRTSITLVQLQKELIILEEEHRKEWVD